MNDIVVKQIQPLDEDIFEEWTRETDDEDILGVGASKIKGEWTWQIFISVAEFIRSEPLESELDQSIYDALAAVPGVTAVVHEDREVWVIQGTPKGEDLVRACSKAVDRLSESNRKAIEAL